MANCLTWHCQVWHVLSFSYISLYQYSKNLICLAGELRNQNFKGAIWYGFLNVANQILLSLIFDSY